MSEHLISEHRHYVVFDICCSENLYEWQDGFDQNDYNNTHTDFVKKFCSFAIKISKQIGLPSFFGDYDEEDYNEEIGGGLQAYWPVSGGYLSLVLTYQDDQ